MSASHLPALDAIAFQLDAALEDYERDTARMLGDWPDLETYREVSAKVEDIRHYCAALPEMRAQWVELLIAHAELVHSLWRLEHGERASAERAFEQVRERHGACTGAMRTRCTRLLARRTI